MNFYLDYLLDLPGVSVETCSQVEGKFIFKLYLIHEGINCPKCGNYTEELHQNRPIIVRDLSSFGRAVYLKVPRRQFYCSQCQKYSTECLSFLDWKRRHTCRYEEHIYSLVKQSSIEQIARGESLSYHEIKGIFDHVYNQKKKEIVLAKRLSIDEVSMRKGHQNFVTVVSDIERGVLLEVLNGHKQEEIIEMLMKQPLEFREGVEEVSIDMWGGFPKVVSKVFPNAVIVFDRFHVMKAVNEELNKIRKKVGIKNRNSKYLLLKNKSQLQEQQLCDLEVILAGSECLRVAYELKEEFRKIYETSKTKKSGQRKLKSWLKIAKIFYTCATETIANHNDGICNYFTNRTTSGVMEGINNRIKLIKRQGYGFSNFDNFRCRLLACLND